MKESQKDIAKVFMESPRSDASSVRPFSEIRIPRVIGDVVRVFAKI